MTTSPLSPLPIPGRAVARLWLPIALLATVWGSYEYGWAGHPVDQRLLGVLSVVFPAICCGTAASLALTLAFQGAADRSLSPVLGSVFARTVLPTAVCFAALIARPEWMAFGMQWKFLVFYLVSLTVETWLAVSLLQAPTRVAS